MKSKNYLGKPDENRGIILFAVVFVLILLVVFVISKIANGNKIDAITIEGDLAVVEKIEAEVNKMEIKDNTLVLEGVLNAGLTQSRIVKLRDVDIVLRNNLEDKYEYNVKYYITSEKIDFSTVLKDKVSIDLGEIDANEYTILLRMKFESASNEEGYAYKYYSLKASDSVENVDNESVKISKEEYKGVLNYLKMIKEQVEIPAEIEE